MLSNSKITLLVTGSIAAYKSAELLRELAKQGADVQVGMSSAACKFVAPLTFQTLSKKAVLTDLFDEKEELEIGHISLADRADLIICAPATADCLAKAAHGIADDLVSTVLLAAKCPILFVPAMNVNMWNNQVTKQNVQKLKDFGSYVLDPEDGQLACGWIGSGRFPEISSIVHAANFVLHSKELKSTKVIVTAGPTIESIDPVRFLSNRSSGKMGYALARVASWLGAEVVLISGQVNLPIPPGIRFIQVNDSTEMKNAVISVLNEKLNENISLQALYMAAAVSDHKPVNVYSEKLKMDKSKGYSLEFEPSADILHSIGDSREDIEKSTGLPLLIVGFAAETGEVEDMLINARKKRDQKKADMIVANLAKESFGNDSSRVWLLSSNGKEEEVTLADKHRIAEKIIKSSLKVL